MSYDVYFDNEQNCIIGKYSGILDMNAIKQNVLQVIIKSEEHKCKLFLNDLREAESQLSTIEIYNLPMFMSNVGISWAWRHAVLISKRTDSYRFFETVSVNRGMAVKIFTDIQAAMEWLHKG